MSTRLYSHTKVSEPRARLNPRNLGAPFAVVETDDGGSYLSFSTAADVLPLLGALAEAVRLLDPEHAPDLLAGVLDADGLAKICQRIAAAAAPAALAPIPHDLPSCADCGAADVPLRDGRCWNRASCDARVALAHAADDQPESAKTADLWQCEDCGWVWPLKDAPYQSAECDACGGTMVKAEAAKAAV